MGTPFVECYRKVLFFHEFRGVDAGSIFNRDNINAI